MLRQLDAVRGQHSAGSGQGGLELEDARRADQGLRGIARSGLVTGRIGTFDPSVALEV